MLAPPVMRDGTSSTAATAAVTTTVTAASSAPLPGAAAPPLPGAATAPPLPGGAARSWCLPGIAGAPTPWLPAAVLSDAGEPASHVEPMVYHPLIMHQDPHHTHPMVTRQAARVLRPAPLSAIEGEP
jgi:hypothetical protein